MFNTLSSHPQFSSPGVNLTPGSQTQVAQKTTVSETVDAGHYAPTQAARSSYSLSERFSREDSFTISLTTKEGDQVEISFNSETRYQSDYARRTGHDGEQQRYSIEKNQSSEFGFTVQGDLNVDELDAIASLVQDISSLANSFFDGDLQTAMQQAADLTLDSSQLVDMKLSMQQSIEYRAVEKYREVQSLGESNPSDHLRAIEPFREQLQHQASRSEQWVRSGTDFTLNLLVNLVQHDSRFNAASDTEQASMKENMGRLGELLSGRHPGDEKRSEHHGDHKTRGAGQSDSTQHNPQSNPGGDAVQGETISAATDSAEAVPAVADGSLSVSA